MHVYNGVRELNSPLKSSVLTIGNFDGVHLGHQQLVETVVREAQHYGIPAVVYTFYPHPVKILKPEKAKQRLFDMRDQQQQMEARGIQAIIIEQFTKEFSQISAEDFLEHNILKNLNPKTLVVGHDFSFGAGRSGNIPFLEQFCAQKGIRLIIIPPFQLDGEVVSSTKIREYLRQGEIEKAQRLLGRPYYVRGRVEPGFKRGRTIGVPTANIHPDVEFLPRQGVYCTFTVINGKRHPSVTNIGVNPTFQTDGKGPVKIETHLLDFDESLYGIEVEVYLLHFIRDEMKFSGIDALKEQISLDIQEARRYFDEQTKNS